MSSGKGEESSGPSMQEQLAMQAQAAAAARPADIALQTSGYGGMGYPLPQNPMQMGTRATGRGLMAPSWASGDWAMPWWGKEAPNAGAAMMQKQNPSAYAGAMGQGNVAAPAPAPAPAPAQTMPSAMPGQWMLMTTEQVPSFAKGNAITGTNGVSLVNTAGLGGMPGPGGYGWVASAPGPYLGPQMG